MTGCRYGKARCVRFPCNSSHDVRTRLRALNRVLYGVDTSGCSHYRIDVPYPDIAFASRRELENVMIRFQFHTTLCSATAYYQIIVEGIKRNRLYRLCVTRQTDDL